MKMVVNFIKVGLSICILTNNVVNSKAMDLNDVPIENFNEVQIVNNTFKNQIRIELVHEHLINIIEELQASCNSFQFNNNGGPQYNDTNNENLRKGLFEWIFEIVENQFILNEKGEYTFDDGIPFLYQITSMVIDKLKDDKRISSLDIKYLNKQFETFCGSAEFIVDNVDYNKISENIPVTDWRYLTSSMLKAAIKNNHYKASNFLGGDDEYGMYLLDILVKDDLDSFQREQDNWIYSRSSITEKEFTVCFKINCFHNRNTLKIIDLSALLGSEKIFKFLLLQKDNKFERNTYQYALSGGNTYIIKTAENKLDEYDMKWNFDFYRDEIICAIKTGQINVAAYIFNKYVRENNSLDKPNQIWLSKSISKVLCDTCNVLLTDCMLLNFKINKSDLEIRNNLIKEKYKPLIEYFINIKILFGFDEIEQALNPDKQWFLDISKPRNFDLKRVEKSLCFFEKQIFQYLEKGSILNRLKFLTNLNPKFSARIKSRLLYLAVENQDLESVEVLLNNGLYQNECIYNDIPPLIMALDKNNEAISKILLKEISGGNEYIDDLYKLFLAVKNDEKDNSHNLMKKLSKDILLKISNELVFLFVQKENIDGIKFFLNQGTNESILLFIVEHLSTEGLRKCDFKYMFDKFAINSISKAICKNDLGKVKYLLEHTINKEKLFNGLLLDKVLPYISAEMLQLLIDEGENLYLGNSLCDKIFSRAVERNCSNVVKFLLEKNLCSQDFVKWFDLIKILKCYSIKNLTLQKKMEMICDYINKPYKEMQMDIDNNILFSSEILNKKINELLYLSENEKDIARNLYRILETEYESDKFKFLHKLLIEVGDPRFLEKAGTTLLHYLVRNSNNECIKQFIDNHKYQLVDLNVTDKDGQTALCLALKLGKFDVARELIERGADIKESMFDLAIGNSQMIDFFLNLIKLGDLRILERDGTSILHYMVKNSNKKDIKQFLTRIHKAVDLNTTDKDGQTALSLAVKLGKFDAVKALIKHGADTNIPIRDLARGNTEMIDFFLNLLKKFNIN